MKNATTHNFDDFFYDKDNELTVQVCKDFVSTNSQSTSVLYISGESGLGKSHLGEAIQTEAELKELRCIFISTNEFVSEMIKAIQNNVSEDFREKYTNGLDLLIIDDLQDLRSKSRTQNEFLTILNFAASGNMKLVVFADAKISKLYGMEKSILSKLHNSLQLNLKRPSKSEIERYSTHYLDNRDVSYEPGIISVISGEYIGNFNELLGYLKKLALYSSPKNKISVDIAKEVISELSVEGKEFKGFTSINRTLKNCMEKYQDRFCIETGIKSLDEFIHGVDKGELVTFINNANMDMGKFFMEITLNMVKNNGVSIAFFSLGTSAQELTQYAVELETGIPSENLKERNLTDENIEDLERAVQNIGRYSIYLNDDENLKLNTITDVLENIKNDCDLKVVFIDDLARVEEIDYHLIRKLSRTCKRLGGALVTAVSNDLEILSNASKVIRIEHKNEASKLFEVIQNSRGKKGTFDLVRFY